jgi:hypothetical protein
MKVQLLILGLCMISGIVHAGEDEDSDSGPSTDQRELYI